MDTDYYKILEVHPEAGIEVIEKAYRALAVRYHPDKHLPSRKRWAEEKFKELSAAYSVLKDPAQRRDYDRQWRHAQRTSASASSAGSSPAAHDGHNEEAYFHYRMGLAALAKAQKATGLDILLGKAESELEKAKESFENVVRRYPESKYAEEAYYRWLKILNETPDHSEAFLRKLEERFEAFEEKFPSGSWTAEVKLEFARFRLLKQKDIRETKKILHFLTTYYDDSPLMREARALGEYLQGVDKKPAGRRERVHG